MDISRYKICCLEHESVSVLEHYLLCMSEPIVILALRRKWDKIESAIAGYERKIKKAKADLVHGSR